MDITNIDNLYVPSTLSMVEMITSNELSNVYKENTNIEGYLSNKIKRKICNKCNHMGFINEDISIINRSIGKLNSTHFNGSVYYNIKLKINVCVPLIGSLIKCKIIGKNDAGVLCEIKPLKIMLCSNLDDLEELEIGSDILVEILNYKIVINEDNIKVLGRLKK